MTIKKILLLSLLSLNIYSAMNGSCENYKCLGTTKLLFNGISVALSEIDCDSKATTCIEQRMSSLMQSTKLEHLECFSQIIYKKLEEDEGKEEEEQDFLDKERTLIREIIQQELDSKHEEIQRLRERKELSAGGVEKIVVHTDPVDVQQPEESEGLLSSLSNIFSRLWSS